MGGLGFMCVRDGIVWGDVLACVFLWADGFVRGGEGVCVCMCICFAGRKTHTDIPTYVCVHSIHNTYTSPCGRTRPVYTPRT